MKLSRLLILIITLLMACIFMGALAIVVNNTRAYLVEQMRSHAQDSATSLGMSLSSSVQQGDQAMMNSMVDAIFDRGYYREIVIRNMSGKVLVSREQAPQPAEVPQWFAHTFVLEAPRGEALVMQGWKQLATITIISHPGHAYLELWRISMQAFWWILAIGTVSLIVVVLVLGAALKPLQEMETLALDISNRKFRLLKKIPWARELRRVASALNAMSVTVERMLGEQTSLAKRMHSKAYQDNITGLANGRSFRERLEHLLQAPEKLSSGVLLFVHLGNFRAYNDKLGHAAGDKLLKLAAQALEEISRPHEQSILARMNGAEFALLVPAINTEEAATLGEQITTTLEKLLEADKPSLPVHTGIAVCRSRQSAAELMATADMALHAAQDKGRNGWHIQGGDQTGTWGDGRWKSVMEDALRNGNITLQFQPVLSCADRRVLFREALVRIATADGNLQPAGVFVPIAKKLDLTAHLDRFVITQALAALGNAGATGKIGVNLFASSLMDEHFLNWLLILLIGNQVKTSQIVFEIHEPEQPAHFEALRPTIQRIRELGAQFVISRFGRSAASIGHLRNFPIDYIKLDGSYSRQIQQHDDNQFFVQSVTGIAHGLGIQVIAEYVESAEEYDTLCGLGVDAAEGYFLGKPGQFGQ